MKRWKTVIPAIMAVAVIGGCAGGQVDNRQQTQPAQTETVTEAAADTSAAAEIGQAASQTVAAAAQEEEAGSPRILITYFTWADNTVVMDREAAVQSALAHYESMGDASENEGVDAVSSASVVQPGKVAQMAGWIQEETGGDLFSIQVTEPYPSDYDACMERASDERARKARPELKEQVPDMDAYDVVAIGYPNWWYGAPMAVLSFIDENDLSGKRILLFCSHGTGGLAGSVREITAELPSDCDVEENVIGIYRADIPGGQPLVRQWLDEIGY